MWNNLSIYLVLPKYLSSKPCSLPHVNLAHILLEVCLGIFLSSSVNGNVLLISNFTCSLLIYRKTVQFCMLTLYPTTLLSLVSFRSSFLHFKIFFYIDDHIVCKSRQVYFFLLDLYSFYFPFLSH